MNRFLVTSLVIGIVHLIVQHNERELTWLVDPTDGSYEILPWGKVVEVASWQRVAPD